jgi:adenosine kinase
VLIGNDYELALLKEKTGLDLAALRRRVAIIVTTYGEQGAEIDAAGEVVRIPIAPPRAVVDPTGAGDAFRAGLLLGLTRGFSLAQTGRIAAQAATYAVEHLGTQVHHYTPAEFAARFNQSFPDQPPLTAALAPALPVASD